jgi:hypothetical protein
MFRQTAVTPSSMIFHNMLSATSRLMTCERIRRAPCRGGSWDFLKVVLVLKLLAFKTISCTFLQRMYLRHLLTKTFILTFILIFVKISYGRTAPSSLSNVRTAPSSLSNVRTAPSSLSNGRTAPSSLSNGRTAPSSLSYGRTAPSSLSTPPVGTTAFCHTVTLGLVH